MNEDRFWATVQRGDPNECWPWTGYFRRSGYGIFAPTKTAKVYAHRTAYALTHPGEQPPMVLHACDNPACCNPAHLFPGDHAANMADMVQKKRQTLGERNPQARLSAEQVKEIREKYRPYVYGCKKLAKEYGVTFGAIWLIVTHRNWKSV